MTQNTDAAAAALRLSKDIYIFRDLSAALKILVADRNVEVSAISYLTTLDFTKGPIILELVEMPQVDLGKTVRNVPIDTFIARHQTQIDAVKKFIGQPVQTSQHTPTVIELLGKGRGAETFKGSTPEATNTPAPMTLSAWVKWYWADEVFKCSLQNVVAINGFKFSIEDYKLVVVDSSGATCDFFEPRSIVDTFPTPEWSAIALTKSAMEQTFYINGVVTP